MKLQIERPVIEALMQDFPRLGYLREQLRFGHRVVLPFAHLQPAELDALLVLYQQGDRELRAQAAQIATLRQALAYEGVRFEADALEMAVPAIARYLAEEAERGWLFSAAITGKPLGGQSAGLHATLRGRKRQDFSGVEGEFAGTDGDRDFAHFWPGHCRAHGG